MMKKTATVFLFPIVAFILLISKDVTTFDGLIAMLLCYIIYILKGSK